MRRWGLMLVLLLPLVGAVAQQAQPPHAWVFGTWTGGYFNPVDSDGPACFGQPTVIFTRDVVMRSSLTEVAMRQRLLETVSVGPNTLEFRFLPISAPQGPFRPPADLGFGCSGNPNLLRVERRGENEIIFPNCSEFPAPLARCVSR